MLKDKICLVTGTSRGIGQAIAEKFAEEGAVVYANARMEGSLEEWAERINATSKGNIVPVYFDVTDTAAMKQGIIKIKKEQGTVDVLVNNAGMVTNELLGMISKEKTIDMFAINVFAPMELTQFVATRFMMKQKAGSIINIASMVGMEGCKGQIAYSASKGAVIAMTKSMAKELASYNIRVNAVAPGMIATERIKNTIADTYKENVPNIAMGRMGTPQEIADACVYFATDASKYTTGQILAVGGGIIL